VALKEGGKLPGGRNHVDGRENERVTAVVKDAQLCLILFDVLLIGEEKLEHLPLKDRRKRLQRLIDTEMLKDRRFDKVLEIVSHKEATTEQEVKAELEREILEDGEGLMLKNPESVYRANMRDEAGWYKLKPEYMSRWTQEYDVIIIGGSHGKNNRSGCMWTWVCGLAVKPQRGKVHPTQFLSFTRIGTGLKHHEFRELHKIMSLYYHKFDLKKYKKGWTIKENGVTVQRNDRGVSVTYPEERIKGETLPEVTVWFSGSAQEEVEVVFDPRKSVVLKIIADHRLTEVMCPRCYLCVCVCVSVCLYNIYFIYTYTHTCIHIYRVTCG
jgi:ATP-dependent DNA ligase